MHTRDILIRIQILEQQVFEVYAGFIASDDESKGCC